MKIKTINKVITAKFTNWIDSIKDEELQLLLRDNCIITGGCIASMLLKETINDFDIYFKNKEVVVRVAEYYVKLFGSEKIAVTVDPDGRVRITTPSGWRGETVGDTTAVGSGEIEDTYVEAEGRALEEPATEDKNYLPVFFSTNAITLTGKIQLVLRFYGEADQIHENYDFVHCTNYWDSKGDKLVLRQKALEAILSRELTYIGSKYPVCSIIRLRKFIARGWTINAGQILKMLLQAGELDLKNVKVLEDQLTGVDSAYFCQLIRQISDKGETTITCEYLVEIIDRLF